MKQTMYKQHKSNLTESEADNGPISWKLRAGIAKTFQYGYGTVEHSGET